MRTGFPLNVKHEIAAEGGPFYSNHLRQSANRQASGKSHTKERGSTPCEWEASGSDSDGFHGESFSPACLACFRTTEFSSTPVESFLPLAGPQDGGLEVE